MASKKIKGEAFGHTLAFAERYAVSGSIKDPSDMQSFHQNTYNKMIFLIEDKDKED